MLGFAQSLDRNPITVFLALLLLYIPLVLEQSRTKLFWHDELFTLYIAQAPSLRAVLHLRKLQADGATLRVLGHFPSAYKSQELYEVTLSPSSL